MGILLISVLLAFPAGKYNDVLNIGDKAPAWEAMMGIDGKKHTLEEWKDKPMPFDMKRFAYGGFKVVIA